jgi:hypothetical protein
MSVKLTNIHNLPDTIVRACLYDTHKVAGDISVSQLIENPRVIHLKRHNDYTEDVSERLYMLMGTSLHHILERGNMENVYYRAFDLVQEKLRETMKDVADANKKSGIQKVIDWMIKMAAYLFPELEKDEILEVTRRMQIGSTVLYGTPDNYIISKETLYDYKFCSVYSYMFPEARHKWDAQTNVYANLLENDGHKVKEIKIIAFFRDWTSHGINRSKDYPPRQVMEIPVKRVGNADTLKYITKRIELHNDVRNGGPIPMCTGKERWATSDTFAVKSKGAKNALRVFATPQEAKAFMVENNHKFDGLDIEHRVGESKKCEKYCPVAKFCDQYAMEKEARRKQSDNL